MLAALLDLVLPQPCAGCAGAGPWCDPCALVLRRAAQEPLGLVRPDPTPAGFPRAAAAAVYAGAVRGALLAHKERGRLGLVRPLGRSLAAAVGCLEPPAGVLLVPVPSSRAAVRQRGHDHAGRLAREAARVLSAAGVPARAVPSLRPARRVGDQSALDAAGRAANLSGAFELSRRLPAGARVVVVDDVVTTGASLTEATRALRQGGVRVHGAATVASTVRWRAHG